MDSAVGFMVAFWVAIMADMHTEMATDINIIAKGIEDTEANIIIALANHPAHLENLDQKVLADVVVVAVVNNYTTTLKKGKYHV